MSETHYNKTSNAVWQLAVDNDDKKKYGWLASSCKELFTTETNVLRKTELFIPVRSSATLTTLCSSRSRKDMLIILEGIIQVSI